MALNLYTSNRMEVLVDILAATLCKPLASAFTKASELARVSASVSQCTLWVIY